MKMFRMKKRGKPPIVPLTPYGPPKTGGRQGDSFVFVGVLTALLVLLSGLGFAQTVVEVPLGLERSPIELTLSPLLAGENEREYKALADRLELSQDDEMITIRVLRMHNPLAIPVLTTLADIVPMTGGTRHLIAAYLAEDPQTGRPTYLLPDWETAIQIGPGQTIVMRLAFIVKKGEHKFFESTLKIYGCFKHSIIQGAYHSISISRNVEADGTRRDQVATVEASDYNVRQVALPVEFQLSKKLNRVSVRELRPPTTPMSPGGPSVFLDGLIGDIGTSSRLPFWIGIPRAVDEGAFDYQTAMQLMSVVADYRERFPDKLARTVIWLSQQNLLLAPTEHRVYLASSAWGVSALPHDAAEVLLFVAEESFVLDLHPSAVLPKPGGYKPIISSNPGEVVGFHLTCTDVEIKAGRVGNSYRVEVLDGQGNLVSVPLTYQRK